jgi:2-polyprenyl-3-methyl-5-hydroxy-6-metoxy-1,4-benzoquinol methylase
MASWTEAKAVIGTERVLLGPQASQQWLHAPEHLAMVLARYRAAAVLIGGAEAVLEVGCGEGIGARILAANRHEYLGIDIDADAIEVAMVAVDVGDWFVDFACTDLVDLRVPYDAVVALDVIEHVADGTAFVAGLTDRLGSDGVCVIGTPNARFDHLASPASRAGHVATYTHDELFELMEQHFRVVQSFGMQDTALHLGHTEARHYLLMCGIGPRG